MKNLLLFFLIFTISCDDSNPDNDKLGKKFKNEKALKLKLLGQWGNLSETTPVWEIQNDSIYYFQESKAYSYIIIDNNFVIDRPNSKAVLRNISVVNDTLSFLDARE